MKRVGPLIIAVVVALAVAPAVAHAQISPLRLNVRKVEKKDRKTTYRTELRSRHEVTETVFYTVELKNAGTTPVANIQIKWAMLVRPRNKIELQIVEGERTCSLDVGRKYVFDTDVIELTGTRWRRTDGRYVSGSGAELLGYAVEVFVGNQRVAADIQPMDTKRKIEQVRAAEEDPKKQNRHRF